MKKTKRSPVGPKTLYIGAPRRNPLTAAEDQRLAFLAHCGGLLGFIPSLLLYGMFKNRGPFTTQESREALNFSFPFTLLAVLVYSMAWIFPAQGTYFAIGSVVIWLFLTIFSVIGAIQVNAGNPYQYPIKIRLFR